MQSIFETCLPRDEVRHGTLSEDMFAARLRDVMGGKTDDVYQLHERFFANTYPTDGLRTLLTEVLGRVTGRVPTNSPILHLETSFGGGKTHNLIALFHAANGNGPPVVRQRFGLGAIQPPGEGKVKIAGVAGSDLDPSNDVALHDDGVTTYTLWGELAYQLGGRSGYALAANSDKHRAAPGAELFESLIGDQPTLIMIDEIARHLRGATGVPTATGEGTLADQTVAFLMSLMEFVASQQRVVLVLTMASDRDAFGKETAAPQGALAESLKISARQERVLTPTGENEISAIVVHRLFEKVDRSAVPAVMQRYGGYFHRLSEQGTSIHDRALRGDYLQEFETSYPFHLELIRVLNLKVVTIPTFQRTHGALRLLANVVRALWDEQPKGAWLIHPYHIVRRYLAIGRITGSAQRMQEFHKEHQTELRKMGEAADLEVRVAITKAYRYLFYPTGDAPKSASYLRREAMPPQDQGDTDQHQTNVVVRVLRSLQKALAADDAPKSGPNVKAKAWDKNQVEMSTEDLRRAFARKIGLPMLLDVNQLKHSIENGVKTQTWLYYAAGENFAYDHQSPPTVWQIGDDAYPHTPEEASRLGLRIKGRWTPPPGGGGTTDDEDDEGPSDEELDALLGGGRPTQLHGQGVPNQAFQQILDRTQEHKAAAIRLLELAFQGIAAGSANDLVRLRLVMLAVKPLTKMARIEAMSHGIRIMPPEEAYYWYCKCTARDTADKAQKALRTSLADE